LPFLFAAEKEKQVKSILCLLAPARPRLHSALNFPSYTLINRIVNQIFVPSYTVLLSLKNSVNEFLNCHFNELVAPMICHHLIFVRSHILADFPLIIFQHFPINLLRTIYLI
jgi:hypothetical protein